MICEEAGCKRNANLSCSIHFKKYCTKHYGKHNMGCQNTPIKIESSKELRSYQIKRLDNKIDQIKEQLFLIANQLVITINNSVELSVYCLDKQKEVIMDIIQIGKLENQINEFLENIPSIIPGNQNSIQCLVDFEKMLSLDVFRKKIKELENKLNGKEIYSPRSTVNSVLKSLENLDLLGKIEWCKEQNFMMINFNNFIGEIKITKDANFVFICMQ